MNLEAFLLLCLAAVAAGPVAYLLTPAAIRLAERAGALAQPGGRHSHRKPTPRWGGMAILAGFFAGGGIALIVGWLLGAIPDLTFRHVAGIATGSLLVAALGAADDRYEIRPLPKFLGQVLCAAILLAAAGVVGILRRRKSCSVRGLRERWRLLLSVALAMVIVYGVLYWLTSYLARTAA